MTFAVGLLAEIEDTVSNLMTFSAPTNFQNERENKIWVRKEGSKLLVWPS